MHTQRQFAGFVLFLALSFLQALGQASAPKAAAVLGPIDAMFRGMSERNPAAIKAAALPGTIMVLMREGKPEQMTIEAFAEHFSKPVKMHMEERIQDPLVRVDHDLAMVWAPFQFLVDGKPDHCGTDLFNLVHTDGKWLIAGIADTGSKNCPNQ